VASSDIRLDKWLWAARFYKTRSLAKAAIDRGHVRCAGERCKAGKNVATGMRLRIRQGYAETEVDVLEVSDQRRGASEARLLYAETPASVEQRERVALARRLATVPVSDERPTKKQRRDLQRFKSMQSE